MKIRKLHLKNIGVFDDEKIEFQPCSVKDKAEIHILTGQNGSGKSTILMALASAFSAVGEFKIDLRNSFEKRFRKSQSYAVEVFLEEGNVDNSPLSLKTLISNQSVFDLFVVERNLSLDEFSKLFISKDLIDKSLEFCPFAYSGYRRIKNEKIELGKEFEENPLYQALEFIKDENSRFTINQWLGRNLSKRALAKEANSGEESKFDENIRNIEKIIINIVGYEIKFKLKTNLQLVLVADGEELDFDVLPDGLKSLIGWIGDLLSRIDLLKWQDDLPIFEKNLILLLDEIEVHLHPAWQRKVLPVVQKLFKNSQIFVSTHSPFVVNSIDNAWVYKLELENGKAKVAAVVESENSYSISQVLRDVFGIEEKFGKEVQDKLDKFEKLRDKILTNGSNIKDEKKLLQLAKSLADEPSDELKQIVLDELRQISKIKGKEYSL